MDTFKKFETGAKRDIQNGKGRLDLLPAASLIRLAKHYEAGAVKYGDRNWETGIPLHSFLDSGLRHLMKYLDGQNDEDHLCAAAWNILCAMWTEEKRPDLIDIPSRNGLGIPESQVKEVFMKRNDEKLEKKSEPIFNSMMEEIDYYFELGTTSLSRMDAFWQKLEHIKVKWKAKNREEYDRIFGNNESTTTDLSKFGHLVKKGFEAGMNDTAIRYDNLLTNAFLNRKYILFGNEEEDVKATCQWIRLSPDIFSIDYNETIQKYFINTRESKIEEVKNQSTSFELQTNITSFIIPIWSLLEILQLPNLKQVVDGECVNVRFNAFDPLTFDVQVNDEIVVQSEYAIPPEVIATHMGVDILDIDDEPNQFSHIHLEPGKEYIKKPDRIKNQEQIVEIPDKPLHERIEEKLNETWSFCGGAEKDVTQTLDIFLKNESVLTGGFDDQLNEKRYHLALTEKMYNKLNGIFFGNTFLTTGELIFHFGLSDSFLVCTESFILNKPTFNIIKDDDDMLMYIFAFSAHKGELYE